MCATQLGVYIVTDPTVVAFIRKYSGESAWSVSNPGPGLAYELSYDSSLCYGAAMPGYSLVSYTSWSETASYPVFP